MSIENILRNQKFWAFFNQIKNLPNNLARTEKRVESPEGKFIRKIDSKFAEHSGRQNICQSTGREPKHHPQ